MKCQQCGVAFTPAPTAPKSGATAPKYCSDRCRRSAEYHRGIGSESVCAHCGKAYRPKHVSRTTFCSRECAYEHRRAKPCVVCGQQRNPGATKKGLDTCLSCRRDLRAAKPKSKPTRKCRICGAEIGRYKQLCEVCIKANRRAAVKRNRKSSRKYSHCSRARRYGVPYEHGINYRTVILRMGAVCGICGDPIDMSVARGDPGYPSLDHIVPMSRGGSHTWDNVQPAHHYCNTVKSIHDMRDIAC